MVLLPGTPMPISPSHVPLLYGRGRYATIRTSYLHYATPTSRSSSASPRSAPDQLLAASRCPLLPLLQPPCSSKPDEYALSRALKMAVAVYKSADRGRRVVHCFVVKLGYCRFTVLMTALVDLAIKQCGDLAEARALFDELTERDVVCWTSMIVGYVQRGHYEESLDFLRKMILEGTAPNSYSYSGALNACSGLRALRHGREVHARLLKVSSDDGIGSVLQNNLLNMYLRCQDLSTSKKVFSTMSAKDIIAWNEMILGYLECGLGEDALRLFSDMVSGGLKPDCFTYATCVNACGYLASLRQGMQIHTGIVKIGFHSDLVVSSALVNMYARCGSVDSAKLVFDMLSSTDTVLWTTMIAAYAKCGPVTEAISTFEQMLEMKIAPDEVTFLAVLSACSHGGLLSKGWHYFSCMTEVHAISAKLEHYSCMVDLLCRSNHLEEALHFIKHIPCEPTVSMWTTFLNSCRLHGNVQLAHAACQFLELDMKNYGSLVALSNAYAAQRYWKEAREIRNWMKGDNVKKEPGCSWVEMRDRFPVFSIEGRSHLGMNEGLQTLFELDSSLRES